MGHVLRWTTAGESHGRALVAVLEGMVAGVSLTSEDIAFQLARRRLGYGRGARMKFERDHVTMLAGVRHGVTLGGPIAIEIGNTEWPKWETVMAPDPVDAAELEVAGHAARTRPPPGRCRGTRGGAPPPAAPASPRPRRLRGHAQIRVRRRPPGARAGQCPRDRRSGSGRHHRPAVPAAGAPPR